MNELTAEEIAYITRLAAAAFTPQEIAIALQVDETLFIEQSEESGSEIFKAIKTGFMTRQLELRERIFLDAKNGSSPAQGIASKLMDNCTIKTRLK